VLCPFQVQGLSSLGTGIVQAFAPNLASRQPDVSTNRFPDPPPSHGYSHGYGTAPPPGFGYGAALPPSFGYGHGYGAPPHPSHGYGHGYGYGVPPPGFGYGAAPPPTYGYGHGYAAPPPPSHSGAGGAAAPPGHREGAIPPSQLPIDSSASAPPSHRSDEGAALTPSHGYGAPPPSHGYGAPPPSSEPQKRRRAQDGATGSASAPDPAVTVISDSGSGSPIEVVGHAGDRASHAAGGTSGTTAE
jgi:hypothetical protein